MPRLTSGVSDAPMMQTTGGVPSKNSDATPALVGDVLQMVRVAENDA